MRPFLAFLLVFIGLIPQSFAQEEEQYVIRAIEAGAMGYITKKSAPEQLVNAIQKVYSGNRYLTDEVAELLALRREPGTSCSDIKLRATEKIEAVDQKIKDLQLIREALSRMVLKCRGGRDLSACPILEELEMEELDMKEQPAS